jgi:hypothetical protein
MLKKSKLFKYFEKDAFLLQYLLFKGFLSDVDGWASLHSFDIFSPKKHKGPRAFTQGKPVVSDILKILVLIGEIMRFSPKNHIVIWRTLNIAQLPTFFLFKIACAVTFSV